MTVVVEGEDDDPKGEQMLIEKNELKIKRKNNCKMKRI